MHKVIKYSPKTQRIWSLFHNLSATSFMKVLLLLMPYYHWKNPVGKGPEINSFSWVALLYNSYIVVFFLIYILSSFSPLVFSSLTLLLWPSCQFITPKQISMCKVFASRTMYSAPWPSFYKEKSFTEHVYSK